MGWLDDALGYESPAKKLREAQDKAYYAEQARIKKLEEERAKLQAEQLEKQAAALEVAKKDETVLQSWTWTQKYLQSQRQVAEGKAKEAEKMKPLAAAPGPADEVVEKIKEIAVPAAGVGLIFWLLR